MRVRGAVLMLAAPALTLAASTTLVVAGGELSAQETPRISVTWTETPIGDVLHAFAAFSGRSIVAGSGLEGVFVTADVNDQPWDVALGVILESRGLRAEEDEHGIIRVRALADLGAREAVEPVVTRAYRIAYARAEELQAAIASVLSERGTVSVLASTNTLVVTDVPRVHRVVAGLIGS